MASMESSLAQLLENMQTSRLVSLGFQGISSIACPSLIWDAGKGKKVAAQIVFECAKGTCPSNYAAAINWCVEGKGKTCPAIRGTSTKK